MVEKKAGKMKKVKCKHEWRLLETTPFCIKCLASANAHKRPVMFFSYLPPYARYNLTKADFSYWKFIKLHESTQSAIFTLLLEVFQAICKGKIVVASPTFAQVKR